jgi:hypothetical protein
MCQITTQQFVQLTLLRQQNVITYADFTIIQY